MKRFKRGLAILLSACMLGGMMPLPTSAQESVSGNTVQTESTEQVQENGEAGVAMSAANVATPEYFSWDADKTLDVSKVSAEEINPQVQTMDTKDAVYTITGKNGNHTALRFVISEDCTVILDNTEFTAGLSYQDGKDISDISNVYNGRYLPAHGVFEVEEGKKVTFRLKGTNEIEGKSYKYSGEEKFLGILLKANATVEFTGSGTLRMANTIGQRILPNYIWNEQSSNVIMTSGTVYCRGFANSALRADNSTYYTPAGAIRFQYNGGWFYNYQDESHESWSNYYTRNSAVGTVCRVEIPVGRYSSGWIKSGTDGTWGAWSDAYGRGTLYAWQDTTNVRDYYVIYNGKYYHYQSGTYADGSYTTGAVDVTSDKTAIGGFSGTVKINGKAVENTDLTFVRNETDGLAYTGTCTTDSNGKYYIALPAGTYMLQNSSEDKFDLSEEKEMSKDITGNAVVGTVTDLNNTPQRGAIVTVQQGDKTLSATTNSNGKYILFPTAFTESSFTAKAEVPPTEPITVSLTWNKTEGVEWNPQIDVQKLPSTVYVNSEDDLVMLSKVADQLHGKTIEIMDDIPLTGKFTGIQLPDSWYYDGTTITLHGNGHTISNMTTPLFIGYSNCGKGNLAKGTVSDLHLQGNIQDTKTGIAGALASSVYKCTISNCSFEGSITGSGMVGGLAGYSGDTTYKNCSVLLNNMSVTSGTRAGGLCGYFCKNNVYNCYVVIKNMSYIASENEYQTATGGIGGSVEDSKGIIENSYAIVEQITPVKLFPMMGYNSGNKSAESLSKITYTNNYTCGGTKVFNTPPNSVVQAVDVSKEVVKATPGTTISGQKALVDCLNEYVNSKSDQTLEKWKVGKDGYPVFLSLDDVSAEDVTVTYDGEPHSITVTGAPDGATITYSTDSSDTKTYSAENPQITDVADSKTVYYRVSYNGKTVDGSAKVAISKKVLTVQAGNQTITYGDTVPSYTANYTGLVARDNTTAFKNSLNYTCTYRQGSDKGSYDIIPSGLSEANYNITYQKGTLTVGVKTIGITWGTTTFDYDGNVHIPTAKATGMVNGDTLELTVATDSGNAIDAADYTARVTGITGTKAGNYELPSNVTQSYTIHQVSLSTAGIVITGADTLTYTGKEQTPGITVTIGGKTLTENKDYTVSYANNINATTDTSKATVTITGKGNYKETASAEFVVKKAALTVKAEDKTIKYGEESQFTATYDGFVNGETKDTAGVFGGKLTFACDYVKAGSTGNSKAGTYTIMPKGLTSANYEITFKAGTLTVGRVDGQVSIASVGNKTYKDADFALLVDKHGSDGALTYTSSNTKVLTVDNNGNVTLKNAGIATITVHMAEGTNHTAASNSIDITVAKKAATLQVTKLDYTVAYGDDIDLGLKTEGESAVTYESTDDAVATAADGKLHIVGVGEATIKLSMEQSTNYLAKDVEITVKVNPAALTITAENKTIEYGTDAPVFTVKYDGFKDGDTADKEGVLSGTLGFDCSYKKGNATNGNTEIYDITPKGLTARNYVITFVKGTLTVKEKAPELPNDSGDGNNTSTNGQNSKPSSNNNTGTSKNDSSKNTDSQNNSDTENKPYIKDDSGKEGWDVISSQLDEAKSGETVTVAMNGTTVVPKNIFDSIKGEDVTLVLDMGNGLSWKINGQDITEPSGDIDFGVTVGADAGKSIPVDVINNVTGERYSMNLSLAYDGEFGFTATLTVNLESKNAGLYANLFYYNEQTGELEFVSAGQIDADGNAELEFTHASDYTIVIDVAVMDGEKKDNGNAEDNTTIPASNADHAKSDAWNPTIIIIIGICILLIVFGAVIFVRKKSGSEKE